MIRGVDQRCVSCGCPWHPASGDLDPVFGVTTCGPCHRAFRDWFKRHAKRVWLVRLPATPAELAAGRKGRVKAEFDFYQEAVTSIRGAEGPSQHVAKGVG
jgi:hypothetical protein